MKSAAAEQLPAPAPARSERQPRSVAGLHVSYGLLVLVTLALVAFGLVMVYSASSGRAAVASGDPAYYLKRQGVYALVGLIAFALLARLDYRSLKRVAGPLLAASMFLLVCVLAIGSTVNGARRWLEFGPVQVQPSELMKIALAVWIASLLARKPAPATLGELVRPVGLVTGLAALLVLVEPDLGTAISFAVVAGAMLLVAGTPLRTMFASSSILVALVLLVSWIEPYRRARLFSFVDPWADPQHTGYQAVQAMIALGSGGVFGVGLGESVSKVNFLPEASTDMIFAVIGEELGLFGASIVILAFLLLGYAGFRIALACRDPFGKRLAAGLTALICGQAAINLGAVLGIAPLTGIPLPFVSYGGSSLIVSLAAVGILLNIAVSNAAGTTAPVRDRSRRDGRTRAAGAGRRGGAAGPRRARDVRVGR